MTGKGLTTIERPAEKRMSIADQAFVDGMNKVFAKLFEEEQTIEGVRKRLARKDIPYALKLMKAWFERRPEDVETLKMLKTELLAKREEVRALRARYARTWRGNKRAKRVAADIRTCEVCGSPLAGKRRGAKTCSTRCRVAMSRNHPLEASG